VPNNMIKVTEDAAVAVLEGEGGDDDGDMMTIKSTMRAESAKQKGRF
jgi:hypothetical protein